MAWLIKGLAWLLLGVLAPVAIWWAWSTGFELFWPFVGLLVAGISLHRSLSRPSWSSGGAGTIRSGSYAGRDLVFKMPLTAERER